MACGYVNSRIFFCKCASLLGHVLPRPRKAPQRLAPKNMRSCGSTNPMTTYGPVALANFNTWMPALWGEHQWRVQVWDKAGGMHSCFSGSAAIERALRHDHFPSPWDNFSIMLLLWGFFSIGVSHIVYSSKFWTPALRREVEVLIKDISIRQSQ